MLVDQRRRVHAVAIAIITIFLVVSAKDGAAVVLNVGSGRKAGRFEHFILSLFFGLR
jgi:hypothetical protein